MKGMEGYRRAMEALPEGIEWAEVNVQRKESLCVGVTDGEVSQADANAQFALYARASGGRAGYAYTQDAREDAARVILRAAENGRACETERTNVLGQGRKAPEAEPPEAEGVQALRTAAQTLCRIARSEDAGVMHAAAEVRMDTAQSRVINSRGLDVGQARRIYAASIAVMADSGGQQVNAEATVTAGTLAELDLRAAAARAVRQAKRQFEQGTLAAGRYSAVLDSSVVINILTTAWQLFAASKCLDGSGALSGFLGEKIASSRLSITDRPRRQGCGYTFDVDDEGCAGGTVTLIDQGMLTGLMHTQATASQMGAEPTGNSGRVALLTGSIPTDLIVVPKVFCVEPGERTQEALLAAMGEGLFITRSFDVFHSVNIGSGDFAIPCSGAVVKEGRPVRHVGGLTMCGNLRALLAGVLDVGNDLWIDEFLLKSYCIGAPSLLVEALQVNGQG